jgi:HEPN domain-containing protein
MEPSLAVNRHDLADVVAEVELSLGIRIRAFRDGMLAFDLGSWGDPVKLSNASPENFEAVAEYQVRCARLMNVHLACLHTVSEWPFKPTVLAPNRVMSVRWADGRLETGGSEGLMGLALWKARTEASDWNDWRLLSRSGPPIATEAMEKSFDLLHDLGDRPDQEVVLLRAELLFRSAAAYSDHDASAALVHAWTAAEGLLGDLLANYLDSRDDLNHERKRYLKSSNVNARVTAEILSLAGRLPAALYEGIERARKRRNRWLHSQERVTSEDAERAIQTAQQLFELVEGVRLQMPLGRQLHSLG